MKHKYLFSLALLLPAAAHAQSIERQVISAAGGSYSGSTFSADYTTGEMATASLSTGSFLVTQGFQQTQSAGTAILETGVLVSFSLYPNPAADQLTLSLQPEKTVRLRITLTNIAGQALQADASATVVAAAYQRNIPLQGLAAGIYFINLYDEQNGLLQSIRFIKQ